MNKSEFTAQIAERTGLSKSKAAKIVDAVFDASEGIIATALRQGEKLTIPGFGTFWVAHRAPRVGRDPRTGRMVRIAAARAASFKAGKILKAVL
jgi:DNA-binding protein HU-beta